MPDMPTKQEFKDKLTKMRAEREKRKVMDYYGYLHDATWSMKRLYRKENLRSKKAV